MEPISPGGSISQAGPEAGRCRKTGTETSAYSSCFLFCLFLFCFFKINFFFCPLQDCMFGQYSVRCILDQDVLLQEDVELIELLDPSLLTLGSSPSGSPRRANTLPRPSLIAKPSLWYATLKQTVENSLSQILNDFFCIQGIGYLLQN